MNTNDIVNETKARSTKKGALAPGVREIVNHVLDVLMDEDPAKVAALLDRRQKAADRKQGCQR